MRFHPLSVVASAVLVSPLVAWAGSAPVCGDVNASSSISTSDALLVLKKSVGQSVVLDCSGYTGQIDSCLSDLGICEARPSCGDGAVEGAEECDGVNLDGQSCATVGGYTGGSLACDSACRFDESGCTKPRWEKTSYGTILDHETGLEWEAKDGADGNSDATNPHDVDNVYRWSTTANGGPNGGIFLDFLAKLNEAWAIDDSEPGRCFAGHCDWRLPTLDEVKTILDLDCGAAPCVLDAAFIPDAGGTVATLSRAARNTVSVWAGVFAFGYVETYEKDSFFSVRAVRQAGGIRKPIDCVANGVLAHQRCWYLGEANEGCLSVCGTRDLDYDDATSLIAGSAGDNASCAEILDALKAPGTGLTFPSLVGSVGVGCSVNQSNQRARVVVPDTSASASSSGIRRACSCYF